MGDQGDLKTTVESLAAAVKALQATAEANAKAIAALSSDRPSSSGSRHTTARAPLRPAAAFPEDGLPAV